MSAPQNQYGLEREIPSAVKRLVRQRCGFGCVVCGTAIIEYHHFDPEFKDAQTHQAKGITLLCPTCHSKVDKGIFDVDFIREANQNPKCKISGFVKDIFFVGTNVIAFKLGGAWFKRLNVLYYDNQPLISFSPPETKNSPLVLNATLFDSGEKQLLSIVDNEWTSGINHFDVQTTSNELIIREKLGDIKLKLSHIANKEIFIEKLDMKYKGFRIQVYDGRFITHSPAGGRTELHCPNLFTTFRLFSDGRIAF